MTAVQSFTCEALLSLAYQVMRFPNTSVADELRALSPLDRDARDDALNELIEALMIRDGVRDYVTHWSEVVPDAGGDDRHGQALDAANTHVELALDALLGGA